MSTPAFKPTISRDELVAASIKAQDSLLKIAKEIYTGTSHQERHAPQSFAANLDTLVQLFMVRHGDGQAFEKKALFQYIHDFTKYTDARDPDTTRENIAGCQHLLDALDLKQQYVAYMQTCKKQSQTENNR